MPTDLILAIGTRSVSLSCSNEMTNSSSFRPGDFLLVDRRDLADAMRRIDDILAGLESEALH